ncbi:MAG: DUF559 domain-containing protein [Thermoleophilia bacterium]|nr:DUF559 domain-containing protein [Thermoleophilia bacterium]
MAATLTCGNGAVLSHRSAAALYWIAAERPGVIEISVRQAAVNEADKHGVIDPESLRRALDERARVPGVRPLRALLDRATFVLSDDELELLFRPIALSAGLPLPMTKQMVNGFEVDLYWPELGLVVETDGWRYHRTPSAQSRDALRDQVHTASGLTPLRFSHRQVKYDPAHVRRVLTDTLPSQVGGSGVTPRRPAQAACSAATSSRPSSPWSSRTRASDSSER